MKFTLALAALAGTAVALPKAQGVTEDLSPTASAPAGCLPTYPGKFTITIVNATTSSSVAKRGLLPRQEESGGPADTLLELTLADGKLTDQQGRTGYIASNYQLQFDKPPQAGTIYDDGFSACSNGSIALGGSAIFYGCSSGEGASKFYNFYDRNWGSHCSPIYIEIIKGSSTAAASQLSDGQVVATSAVSIRSDGQPVVPTPVPVRSDGQPVATTIGTPAPESPVPVRSDGQPIASTIGTPAPESPVPVRSDGQPIATSIPAAESPVPVRSDGQPIASTIGTPAPVVSSVSTPAPPQTPISTPTPVSTPIPVSTPTPVSTSAPSSAAGTPASTPTPSQYTGAADRSSVRSGIAFIGAAAVAVAML